MKVKETLLDKYRPRRKVIIIISFMNFLSWKGTQLGGSIKWNAKCNYDVTPIIVRVHVTQKLDTRLCGPVPRYLSLPGSEASCNNSENKIAIHDEDVPIL
ncbi:unnamed protein product [Allacma fusca]|uniref:Uncharacterized protein n=1 Tax=Allacma fusca TaxID=39272 RepID=A0A8J2Q750_9HEXA|nr:unnamed protein product [Allacma fusca]